ncbi:MarR family transcriptional regulator [Rhodococcus sp. SC4]|nr:MarR family transcriptional regulator [Rhodococcus sp. SC4]
MRSELTERQRRAWRVYIEGSLRLETRLDEALRAATGLSMIDYHVLLLLSEAPEQRLRMSEIAARMVFSRSRITYQIGSMAKRGLVAREPAPDDGRGSRAVLTASGLRALQEAAPPHARSARELFLDDLDPTELDCIERVFSRLNERLP